MWTRLDALAGKPITTGPAYAPGDTVIETGTMERHNLTIDILNVFHNADEIMYSALASCVCITAALLAFFVVYETRQSIFGSTLYPRQMMNSLWDVFSLVVDQEDFKAMSLKTRLLWTSFVIAAFFSVVGYFLNSMSTDQVAHRPVAQIESIDDLILGRFPDTPPYVIKNNFLYPLLSRALNGSKLNRLLKVIQRGSKEQIIEMDYKGEGMAKKMANTKQKLGDNTGCLLIAQLYHEHVIKRFICHDDPDLGLKIRVGREMFGGGISVWMVRRGLDDCLRRFANFRLDSLREFGIVDNMTPMIIQAFLDAYGWETKWENLKCIAGAAEEKAVRMPHLKMESFHKLQVLFFGGMLIAVIAWMLEVIITWLRAKWRTLRRPGAVKQALPSLGTATKLRWIHGLKIPV